MRPPPGRAIQRRIQASHHPANDADDLNYDSRVVWDFPFIEPQSVILRERFTRSKRERPLSPGITPIRPLHGADPASDASGTTIPARFRAASPSAPTNRQPLVRSPRIAARSSRTPQFAVPRLWRRGSEKGVRLTSGPAIGVVVACRHAQAPANRPRRDRVSRTEPVCWLAA